MKIVCQLDWLSITLPSGANPPGIFPLGSWHFLGKGSHGYRLRYVDQFTGIVCELDSPDPDMGCHFEFNGQTLDSIRRIWGRSDDTLLSGLLNEHGKASRVDLALDLHGAKMTPLLLKRELKRGRAQTRARTWRWIEGQEGDVQGSTIYMGSKDSDRQLRLYDKAAERMIVNGEAWVRLELQLRRLRANAAFSSAATNGMDITTRSHLQDFLLWPNREYKQALEETALLPDRVQRADTDRQKWLLGQVAGALAQEMILDQEFLARMIASARAEMDRIKALETKKG
jgi:hypothetical protein